MQQRHGLVSGVDDWTRRRPWLVDGLLALALAAVLLPTSAELVSIAPWPAPVRTGVLAMISLGFVAVVVRRRHPLVAYAACCLVMLTLLLVPDLTSAAAVGLAGQVVPPILLPSSVVFLVVLYSVAAYASRPWPTAALAVGLAGAALTTARLWAVDWAVGQAAPVTLGWHVLVAAALVAAVLAPWGLGRFRSVRAAYVVELEQRAARAEEQRAERAEQAVLAERARIAREMHDVVAHSLAVIVRQADGGRFAVAGDPRRAGEVLAAVAATGREALADMRAAVGVLRGDATPDDDVAQSTVDDVPGLVQRLRDTGLQVSLRTTGDAAALDRATSLAAFRVVQEALTNVVKHAGGGAAATVRLDWCTTGLDIAVTDDGGGAFEDSGTPPDIRTGTTGRNGGAGTAPGRGLIGMRERVALVGGRLSAAAGSGHGRAGFAVRAHLPPAGGHPR